MASSGHQAATHFQPFRRLGYGLPPTLRTGHRILAHSDHFRFGRRQFSDLVHRQKQPGFRPRSAWHSGHIQPHFHDMTGSATNSAHASGDRPADHVSVAPLFGQTALLISGGRLRRILRRGRWLLVLLELQFQRLIVRLQSPEGGLKLGNCSPCARTRTISSSLLSASTFSAIG